MERTKYIYSGLVLLGALTLVVPTAWSQGVGDPGAIPERMEPPQPEIPQSPAEHSQDGAEKVKPESAQQGEENVKEIQQALKDQGYDPGPVDGILGPKTEQALKSFQEASGLEATGKLDASTAQKLGVDSASKGNKESNT